MLAHQYVMFGIKQIVSKQLQNLKALTGIERACMIILWKNYL